MIRFRWSVFLMAGVLLAGGLACKKTSDSASPAEKAAAEAKAIVDEAAAAEEAANKPAPKPESKMKDDLYIEITARSALIHDKYKEEPDKVEPEMERVFEKLGVTQTEYQEFKKALTPDKEGELNRKVQEKIQTLEREYK
jgi:hypothetical protein